MVAVASDLHRDTGRHHPTRTWGRAGLQGEVERALNYLISHSPGYTGVFKIDIKRMRRWSDLSADVEGSALVMHTFRVP